MEMNKTHKLLLLVAVLLVCCSSAFAYNATNSSIDACGTIEESGTYQVTADIGSAPTKCIKITADDVVINGNGHTITGTGSGSGFYFSLVTKLTVSDLALKDFGTGVLAANIIDILFENFNVTDYTVDAIVIASINPPGPTSDDITLSNIVVDDIIDVKIDATSYSIVDGRVFGDIGFDVEDSNGDSISYDVIIKDSNDNIDYDKTTSGPQTVTLVNYTFDPITLEQYTMMISADGFDTFTKNFTLNQTLGTITINDTTAPNLSIITPLPQLYTHDPTLKIFADDGNLDTVWYTYGLANMTYSDVTILTLPDGNYTIYAWANDTYGHLSMHSVNFTIEQTPPNVTITGNVTYQYPANISLLVNASDASGVKNYSVNDTRFTMTNQTLVNTVTLPVGTYDLTIAVTDNHGNINITTITITVVDTTPPQTRIMSISSKQADKVFTVKADVTDYHNNITILNVTQGNVSFYNATMNITNGTVAIKGPKLSTGTYTISMISIDRYGNKENKDANNSMNVTFTKPAATPQSSGGGGGGGDVCVSDWQCSEWTACVDGQQTRTCQDRWSCTFQTGKPEETQSCTVSQPTTTQPDDDQDDGQDDVDQQANATSQETLSAPQEETTAPGQAITGLLTGQNAGIAGIILALLIVGGLIVFIWRRK